MRNYQFRFLVRESFNVSSNKWLPSAISLDRSIRRPVTQNVDRRLKCERNIVYNIISTNSTVTESTELSQSAKLDELWKDRKIEQGMVRIPTNLLDDLIRKESIENFYIVEDTPVAR